MVLALVALVLSLPTTVLATYPGSTNGRLAIGSGVDGNFDIYTVRPGRPMGARSCSRAIEAAAARSS
jgi:hypothetical protein